jgi:hypothetical protein
MNIIDILSPSKKRFFESLGIIKDTDIPRSFFDKINSYKTDMTDSEKFYCEDYTISGSFLQTFCMKDIVGTDHDVYASKSWLQAFIELNRGDKTIDEYFLNPKYYDGDLKKGNTDDVNHSSNIGLVEKNGQYYIHSSAGGGNNRMILMKLKYLALIEGKDEREIEEINRQLSFTGNVRQIPSNHQIPDLIEALVWRRRKYNYAIQNISQNSTTIEFRILQGEFLSRSIIADKLSEGEFVKMATLLLEKINEVQEQSII